MCTDHGDHHSAYRIRGVIRDAVLALVNDEQKADFTAYFNTVFTLLYWVFFIDIGSSRTLSSSDGVIYVWTGLESECSFASCSKKGLSRLSSSPFTSDNLSDCKSALVATSLKIVFTG